MSSESKKKRKLSQKDTESTKKSQKKPKKEQANLRPIFIIATGSGGSLPKDKVGQPPVSHSTLLETIGDIHVCSVRGGNGATRKVLQELHSFINKTLKKTDANRPVFLVGQSFGSRLIAHLVNRKPEKETKKKSKPNEPKEFDVEHAPLPSNIKGLVLCGYPIQNMKGSSEERSLVVKALWQTSSYPILFVKGTRDADYPEFSKLVTSSKKANAKVNVARIVHTTADGGHNPFDGPKTPKLEGGVVHYEHQNKLALDAVIKFVSTAD
eukprot:m.97915 g.97915  ORF g.97915 m.97915 type:complete len:267 (+) comp27022_c0_seq1:391-1191(+)